MKILFLPLPVATTKPWTGCTIYTQPLGGSESAVAYTARSLARMGHEVHVYVQHAQVPSEITDAVKYYGEVGHNPSMFNQLLDQEWDSVVSSRWPDILNQPWKTKQLVLWLHDMGQTPMATGGKTKIVFVSEFQRVEGWRFADDGNYTIIGNGVDLSLFEPHKNVVRDKNKLIWISNPDRGLAMAAKILHDQLLPSWPNLELHVYGSAEVYGYHASVDIPHLPRPEHRRKVFMHKSLNRRALAKVLSESWAMFYPTFWPETYCMAALEAQAAGCPVIAPPLAALNTTVKGGILGYDYKNAISQLRNVKKYKSLSDKGREFASTRDWEHRAVQWIKEVFEEALQ